MMGNTTRVLQQVVGRHMDFKRLQPAIVVLLLLVMSGCVSYRPTPPDDTGTTGGVITVDSAWARISEVHLTHDGDSLQVRGRLTKRLKGRGTIPGHLHIEIIAEDGTLIAQGLTRYQRFGSRTRLFGFSRQIDVQPEQIHQVRIIHHV